ncbi:hypothetical protein MASR2M79_24970 [Aminivibrio sp.]
MECIFGIPHIIPLVELIRADETADETVDDLKELMYSIDKEPVIVQKRTPGFIGNRLNLPYSEKRFILWKESPE